MSQTWQSMCTDEKVKAMRRLAAAGMSALQIADQFPGATRNAVIGLAYRKGVRLSGRDGPAAKGSKTNVVALPMRKSKPAKAKFPHAERAPADVIVLKPKKKREKGEPVSLFDLTFSTCRGPLNASYRGLHPDQMMFCGEVTIPNSSYCENCSKRFVVGKVPLRNSADGQPARLPAKKRVPVHRWPR